MQILKGNDATKRLASVEEELKAANLKVDVLTGQLADANHNLNQVTLRIMIKKHLRKIKFMSFIYFIKVRAELERFNVAEATKQMDPNDATTELNHQIKVNIGKLRFNVNTSWNWN